MRALMIIIGVIAIIFAGVFYSRTKVANNYQNLLDDGVYDYAKVVAKRCGNPRNFDTCVVVLNYRTPNGQFYTKNYQGNDLGKAFYNQLQKYQDVEIVYIETIPNRFELKFVAESKAQSPTMPFSLKPSHLIIAFVIFAVIMNLRSTLRSKGKDVFRSRKRASVNPDRASYSSTLRLEEVTPIQKQINHRVQTQNAKNRASKLEQIELAKKAKIVAPTEPSKFDKYSRRPSSEDYIRKPKV